MHNEILAVHAPHVAHAFGLASTHSSKDNTIRFWDITSGLCVNTLQGHLGEVTSVAVNSTGNLLVSCSKDNSNRLWDLRAVRAACVCRERSICYCVLTSLALPTVICALCASCKRGSGSRVTRTRRATLSAPALATSRSSCPARRCEPRHRLG